jgi:hypothetical protein
MEQFTKRELELIEQALHKKWAEAGASRRYADELWELCKRFMDELERRTNAGCDSCGQADREPGSKFCVACAADKDALANMDLEEAEFALPDVGNH